MSVWAYDLDGNLLSRPPTLEEMRRELARAPTVTSDQARALASKLSAAFERGDRRRFLVVHPPNVAAVQDLVGAGVDVVASEPVQMRGKTFAPPAPGPLNRAQRRRAARSR